MKCLFSLAKNRNEYTRIKFYELSLVSFLASEVSLEFEYKQTRKKFISVGKKTAKEANEADFNEDEDMSPTKLSSKIRPGEFGEQRGPLSKSSQYNLMVSGN